MHCCGAHRPDPLDLLHLIGSFLNRLGDIRRGSDRDDLNLVGIPLDRINDEIDRVAVLRLLLRVDQIGVAHAVGAEYAECCLNCTVNGIGGALVDRRVAACGFQCRKRVLSTLFQIDVAHKHRNAEDVDILGLCRKDQRRRVISSGIGVDNDLTIRRGRVFGLRGFCRVRCVILILSY